MKESKPLIAGLAKVSVDSVTVAVVEYRRRLLAGRGLHSSTIQLNLSRSSHNIHPEQPTMPPNTALRPPQQPLHAPPIQQKALALSRKVDECKPLLAGVTVSYSIATTDSTSAATISTSIITTSHVWPGRFRTPRHRTPFTLMSV